MSTTLAWRGISLKMPEEWSVGVINEKSHEGVLNVEDREIVRMEIKWHKLKAGYAASAEKAIEAVRKQAKKARKNISINTDLHCRTHGSLTTSTFSVRGDWNVDYLVASHADVGAYVAVMGKPDEKLEELSIPIFESVRIRTEPKIRWCIFGLDAFVPSHYELVDQVFMTGKVGLYFQEDSRLSIEKYGPAGTTAMDEPLKWVLERHPKKLRMYRLQAEKTSIRSHEAHLLSGYKKLRPSTLLWYGRVDVLLWHCGKTTKTFMVMLEHSGEEDVHALAKGVHCH